MVCIIDFPISIYPYQRSVSSRPKWIFLSWRSSKVFLHRKDWESNYIRYQSPQKELYCEVKKHPFFGIVYWEKRSGLNSLPRKSSGENGRRRELGSYKLNCRKELMEWREEEVWFSIEHWFWFGHWCYGVSGISFLMMSLTEERLVRSLSNE